MIKNKVLNHIFSLLQKKVPIYLKHSKYQTFHAAPWHEKEEGKEDKGREREGRQFGYTLWFLHVFYSINNALIACTEAC